MMTRSLVWHNEHLVTIDMRRLRPLLHNVPPDAQQEVIKNFRLAYPELLIDLTPKGDVRIEATK